LQLWIKNISFVVIFNQKFNQKRMKQVLLTLTLFIFATATLNPAFGAGKPKKSVKVNSMAMPATRGANPKVKSDRPSSDKQEQKARGTYCDVQFYNHTGYTIDIYVDGNYKGTLGAYASGTVTVYSGYTTIYCVSVGKTKYWEANGNCDGVYTYDLYN